MLVGDLKMRTAGKSTDSGEGLEIEEITSWQRESSQLLHRKCIIPRVMEHGGKSNGNKRVHRAMMLRLPPDRCEWNSLHNQQEGRIPTISSVTVKTRTEKCSEEI